MIKSHHKEQDGFTLIELMICIVVIGLLMGAVLSVFNTVSNDRADYVTHKNMKRVIKTLALYADANGRLPCPAQPNVGDELFGWEKGVIDTSIDGTKDASGNPKRPQPIPARLCKRWGQATGLPGGGDLIGIVPFQTLGLSPEEAQDGWGRYFTYAVNPIFAQINDDIDPMDASKKDEGIIHAHCLDQSWLTKDAGGTRAEDIINGPKAKFCCLKNGRDNPDYDNASGATDLVIVYNGVATPISNQRLVGADIRTENFNAFEYDVINYDEVTAGDWKDGAFNNLDYYKNPASTNDMLDTITDSAFAGHDEVRDTFGFSTDSNVPYAPDYTDQIDIPAMVLVSHGANGYGAFLANESFDRYRPPGLSGLLSSGEIENGAGDPSSGTELADSWDNQFADGIRTTSSDTSFDDIVMWRTANGLLAETGGSSCRYP